MKKYHLTYEKCLIHKCEIFLGKCGKMHLAVDLDSGEVLEHEEKLSKNSRKIKS